jgi:hypothetical protein
LSTVGASCEALLDDGAQGGRGLGVEPVDERLQRRVDLDCRKHYPWREVLDDAFRRRTLEPREPIGSLASHRVEDNTKMVAHVRAPKLRVLWLMPGAGK